MSDSLNIARLKAIIAKINTLLNSDYNISSFSALAGEKLIKIVLKIFNHLGIEENTPVHSSYVILNVLKALKYSPEGNIEPNDFREGLVMAKKEIIYPILSFLLENEENIKTRYYLSKYVDEIEIPSEFFKDDARMQSLHKLYLETIDKFWSVYSDNIKEATSAKETKELEDDIAQMRLELKNLERRIELQSRKTLPETFFDETSLLVKERKKNEKINGQLENDKVNLQKQIDTVRFYNRREVVTSLEDLLEKSEKYASSLHVYSLSFKDISQDLLLTERVANEVCLDLDSLQEEQFTLQQLVNNLSREKELDDSVQAMQNQQRVLSKKKALLSKQVVKLRLDNDLILNKNEEICRILGGDVLKGKVFKDYVSDLKSLCKVYKQNKQFLKGLEQEEEVLKHTLENIYLLEPDIKKKIDEFDMKSTKLPGDIQGLGLEELKVKTESLFKQHQVILRQCCDDEDKFSRVKKSFCDSSFQLGKIKHEFNEETDNLLDKIVDFEEDIKNVKGLLKIEEDDLRKEEEEFEKLQDNLLRYSQMFIENAGDISTSEVLKHKLQIAEDTLDDLKKQVREKQKEIEKENKEKRKTEGVIILIKEGKLQM